MPLKKKSKEPAKKSKLEKTIDSLVKLIPDIEDVRFASILLAHLNCKVLTPSDYAYLISFPASLNEDKEDSEDSDDEDSEDSDDEDSEDSDDEDSDDEDSEDSEDSEAGWDEDEDEEEEKPKTKKKPGKPAAKKKPGRR